MAAVVNEEMFAAFAAFMAAQQEAHEEKVAPRRNTRNTRNTRTSKAAPRGTKASTLNRASVPTRTKPSRTTPKIVKGAITCEQAWKALGSDPTFKPSQPTAPARNGQLWALNAAGKLRLV